VADLLPQGRIGLLAVGEVSAPTFQSPSRGGPVTVMIDHGVTENPIEPRNHLLVLHLCPALQSARKRRLENIFGGRSRFDASFQERQKFPMSVNQSGNGFR